MSEPPVEGTPGWLPVTEGELNRRLQRLWDYVLGQTCHITNLEERMAASQADIDALTAALAQEDSDLNQAVAGIQAEIAQLQQQNPALDISGLQTQVSNLATAVADAAALVPPAPPAPPAGG